jgi:hypothetical protein
MRRARVNAAATLLKTDNFAIPTRVLSAGGSRKQGQQIAHLVRSLFPIGRRGRYQLHFQCILRLAQRAFVGGDLSEEPTKVGCLLRSHSAMLVEIDRFVCHGPGSRSRAV